MKFPVTSAGRLGVSLALSSSAILGALILQHGFGYLPCKLCLEQRVPYYAGIPILMAASFFLMAGMRRSAAVLALVAASLFAYGAFLGGHHAGVEWKLWEGPGDCGMITLGEGYDAASLLDQIMNTKVVSCTDAALRIFGLSLAGWNAVVAAVVSLLSFSAAFGIAAKK